MDKTFTREQFDEAVKKATEKYVDITLPDDEVDPKKGLVVLMMGLQNNAFAALIEEFLFGEEPSKEDTTNVNDEKEGK